MYCIVIQNTKQMYVGLTSRQILGCTSDIMILVLWYKPSNFCVGKCMGLYGFFRFYNDFGQTKQYGWNKN